MTIKQLAKEICKREGLKKQVDIAQVNEILGHLSDVMWDEFKDFNAELTIGSMLVENGRKRAKRKKK